MTAYCVKCKATREITAAQSVTLKNGTPTIQGICPACGTRLSRLLPRSGASPASRPV